MSICFLGLGGNLGSPKEKFDHLVKLLEGVEGLSDLRLSACYETTPVSDIPQPNYINAVLELKSKLDAKDLFNLIKRIEVKLGKVPKEKNEPREIDVDLLLYGEESYRDEDLQVPHPRMWERLFVLRPLRDLTQVVMVDGEMIDLQEIIDHFKNIHGEEVKAV